MDNKISIIVALYNTKKYLTNFFDCILKQTYTNYEVVIVDDLSTDGSFEFCQNFISEHKELNIKLIKGEKKMLPDLARQLAFKYCTGKYVIYLDSDDMFSDDYLESMVSIMIKYDLDFAVSSCQRINESGEKKGKKRKLSNKSIPLMTAKQKNILIKGRYGGWNRMAKRTYLISHQYDFLSAELPLYILEFDAEARVGYTINGCYFYRMRGDSISSAKVPERIANYDLLEPLKWFEKINLDKKNKKPLAVYLYRMILPYIFYKHFFKKDYDFKSDIKLVKKTLRYSFWSALKWWWVLDKRDKVMLFCFMFHFYKPVYYFISKYRQ